jgi:hypothetical protein
MHSKFWFGNLHYKDFTVDEKLILREVLKKQFGLGSCDLVQGVSDGHKCRNEPAGFMKVANFSCSATVSFSNTRYGSHA